MAASKEKRTNFEIDKALIFTPVTPVLNWTAFHINHDFVNSTVLILRNQENVIIVAT